MGDGEGGGFKDAVAGVFSSKLIGVAFALAFGAWAYNVDQLTKEVVATKTVMINNQNELMKEVSEIKGKFYNHELYSASTSAEFRSSIANNIRRLEDLEEMHNGTRHTRTNHGQTDSN